MPHEWNNLIVVTKEELVPNWFSWDNLKKTVDRYKERPIGVKRVQLGGNGRVMLIDFDTLPLHVQHGLGDPRLVKHVFEKCYRNDKDAVRFFNQFRFDDGTYLDIEYQQRYIINANVIQAALCLKAEIEKQGKKKGKAITGIYNTLCDHAISFNKTLATKHKYEHTLPGSEKHFKTALNKFESQGYKSLISGKHGNSNSRKVYDNTMALLESMFAKDTTKPNPTEVYQRYDGFIKGRIEVINNDTGELYDPNEFKAISESTVRAYLTNWESAIGTYALRSGDRQKYMQQFKPAHGLDRPHFAGSIISVDDRQPPFKMHNGKRMWYYNAIDLASGAIICSVWGESKEGIILEFYRELIRVCAYYGLCMPAELEGEKSLNSSYEETFLKEGAMFEYVRIEANNARGKRIEAYYRPLRYKYEKKRIGWIARPFALSESNQAGSHQVVALTKAEIVEGCNSDIEAWNNDPHEIETEISKWDYFVQNQNPELKPINYPGFLPYLGHKTTTSCRAGKIKLNNVEFVLGLDGVISHGEPLVSLMKRVEGNVIDVYWLDDVNGNVLKALVFIGTLMICEAIAVPTYNRARIEQTDAGRKAREIMSKYVATIEAYGKSRKRAIDSVTIIDNTPAPKKTFVMPRGIKSAAIVGDGGALPDPDETNLDFTNISFVPNLKDTF